MNTAVARLNWEGQVVDGKFPLQKWLGGSERCDVFRTELPGQPPQAAAIKLVSADAGNAERQVNRWQTVATLTHPNLLRVLHAGQCQINSTPLIYVVMEYAEEDLSQVMPLRALSPEEARETLMPLVAALSYLHEKSFVHSRIKPPNIMAVGDQLKLSSDSIHAVNESACVGCPGCASADKAACAFLTPRDCAYSSSCPTRSDFCSEMGHPREPGKSCADRTATNCDWHRLNSTFSA